MSASEKINIVTWFEYDALYRLTKADYRDSKGALLNIF